ncbi:hypothetical protein [Actinophytocola sp.]|uniref:hypothetical protein n=1 Tax=Actinophytocola sp. TaxID=1872138 RepID=UPI003D6C3BD8
MVGERPHHGCLVGVGVPGGEHGRRWSAPPMTHLRRLVADYVRVATLASAIERASSTPLTSWLFNSPFTGDPLTRTGVFKKELACATGSSGFVCVK